MRALVIGAGAIGLSTALRLSGEGWDIAVVDASESALSTSTLNAGWVVPSMATPIASSQMLGKALKWMVRPDSPFYVAPSLNPTFARFMIGMLRSCAPGRYERALSDLARLSATALTDHEELHRLLPGNSYASTPLTSLHQSNDDLDHHVVDYELMRQHLPQLQWTVHDRHHLEGVVGPVTDAVTGGITVHGQGMVQPAAFVRELASACLDGGIEIRPRTSMQLEVVGGRVIGRESSTGAVHGADAYVVAAGVGTNPVLRRLGERVPIAAGKGYGYDFDPAAADVPHPLYLAEAKVAMTPGRSGTVRAAGTMGIGAASTSVRQNRARAIATSIGDYLPAWRSASTPAAWTGTRCLSPDGLPVIGATRRWKNVVVATGHSMLGITLAPTTARIVAEVLDGGEGFPPAAPSRF